MVLVTIKTQSNSEGGVTDVLTGEARDVDPHATVVAQAQKSKIWKEYIENGLKV